MNKKNLQNLVDYVINKKRKREAYNNRWKKNYDTPITWQYNERNASL